MRSFLQTSSFVYKVYASQIHSATPALIGHMMMYVLIVLKGQIDIRMIRLVFALNTITVFKMI